MSAYRQKETIMAERAWLKRRLAEIGKTQAALADTLGLPPPRISEIIRGSRRVSTRELPRMATFLNMPLPELMRRLGAAVPESAWGGDIAIAGYVGAGAEVRPVDDHAKGAGLDMVDRPPGARGDLVAVKVRGDSMVPAYSDADEILYGPPRKGDFDSLIGRECIVRLPDGRMYVKRLKKGRGGKWTLASWNAPDIEVRKISWAAPVVWVKRAG
jgi:SOS-response transcriptional repressor LexA